MFNLDVKTPYVFISYSSKNTAQAEAVRNLLDKHYVQSWMALHDIPAGARYAHIIDEAIENCSCVLLLLTKDAQGSDHVDREIERATSYEKEIIPMRLDRCALNSGFRYYISSRQIIDVDVIDETNSEMQMVLQRLQQLTDTESDAFRWLLEGLKKWQHSPKTYIMDPKRILLLREVYGKIIALLHDEGYNDGDYKITVAPDPLEMGDASISLVCDDITIHNIKAFCDIVQHFDNFEIYPLLDNKLHFAGVFRKIAHVSKNNA